MSNNVENASMITMLALTLTRFVEAIIPDEARSVFMIASNGIVLGAYIAYMIITLK